MNANDNHLLMKIKKQMKHYGTIVQNNDVNNNKIKKQQ